MDKAEKKYKWESPYAWLCEQSANWTAGQLRAELLNFAQLAGFDTIQEIYQSDMDKDGYFKEISD